MVGVSEEITLRHLYASDSVEKSMQQMNIFVVGSKPDAIFPDVSPDRIYACNGAISLYKRPSETTEIVGVISRAVVYSKKPQDAVTRRQWAGSKVNRLIVAGGREASSREDQKLEADIRALGLEFNRFLYVGNHFHKKALEIRFKKRLFFEVFRRLTKAAPERFFVELKRTRFFPEMRISSGVRSLLIAKEEAPKGANFYLVGIGARKSRGHFYDSDAMFFAHALQDRNLLIDFSRRYSGRLFPTDPVLSRFLARYG